MNTHGSRVEIFCGRQPFFRDVQFWFKHLSWTPDMQRVSYGAPITLNQKLPEHECLEVAPTFSLKDEECQHLIDELWRVGFRPSEGSGSTGSLAATERHLADMRHLVFKTKPQ
jgi:hypothetical protein